MLLLNEYLTMHPNIFLISVVPFFKQQKRKLNLQIFHLIKQISNKYFTLHHVSFLLCVEDWENTKKNCSTLL